VAIILIIAAIRNPEPAACPASLPNESGAVGKTCAP